MTAHTAPQTPRFRAATLASLTTRALLVLLAAPAVLIGAAAALCAGLLALPLLLVGKGGPRPALRWHGRRTAAPAAVSQDWSFPAEPVRRAA
ncbi:MAG: hypothetical protein IPG57_19980 [Burkholderiales bacterium]|jgi:hypothetical protein|nr:hypothetical protein [Burkholderiales bacterium]MBP7519379.1 hypothetical protein [Leptothrix sp. (in: b-proteobacteria)]HQY09319.1 hypothetical protein [Burkholderiaceae bacterium]